MRRAHLVRPAYASAQASFVAIVLLSTAAVGEPAPPPAPPEPKPAPLSAISTSWDLNIEGAAGHAFDGAAGWSGLGRVRAGIQRFDQRDRADAKFLMVGLSYELSDVSKATFLLQGEVLSLTSGTWLQLGAGADITPRPAFMGALGWSLFGIEGQARWDDPQGAFFAVYGKVRVPIGVIVQATR